MAKEIISKQHTRKCNSKVTANYNVGLNILRTIMCLEVVLCHFWFPESCTGWKAWLLFLKAYAVPVFMLMSFLLTEKTIISLDKKKLKKRFGRLLYPHYFWAIVYWFIYNLLDHCIGYGFDCRISDLMWQIFTGHSSKLNGAMWYQINLALLTLLFVVISHIFKKSYLLLLCICMMGAWFFQYSGWNWLLFGELRFELTYPLGRFSEMLPYAVCGFMISYFRMYEKLKETGLGG